MLIASMVNKNFGFGTQIRKSPYFDSTVKWGATGFSVYNHMYIPRDFGNPEKNFWNLIEKSILCDVAVERQVEITGPDAYKFIQLLTPRDLSNLAVGQCKYVLITNNEGGILNDPVLLRLAENHFWLSLADSDILLWAQGVAINSNLNVKITEPDVSPLQLQGPKSAEIMIKLFGEGIKDLKSGISDSLFGSLLIGWVQFTPLQANIRSRLFDTGCIVEEKIDSSGQYQSLVEISQEMLKQFENFENFKDLRPVQL